MKIVFDQFPIAPQANNLFPTVKIRGKMRRVKSGEYKKFEREVEAWAAKREGLLTKMRREAEQIVSRGCWIQTHMFFCLPREKIFTKAGTLHRWDACNRVKATHDVLSKLLGIDDRHFAVGAAEKVQTSLDPYTLIVIQPATMISDQSIIEEVSGWVKSVDRVIL